MEDKCNTGGTTYRDQNGKEITEAEYKKLLKKQPTRIGGKNTAAEDIAGQGGKDK